MNAENAATSISTFYSGIYLWYANTINGEINALTAKANRVLSIWKWRVCIEKNYNVVVGQE